MKFRDLLFGAPKSPLDPKVFERLALAAFLAWVGLGADGLSSSCYGPEEIFKELGPNRALAPFLILAVGVTVAILSAAYAHTIESFPGGGGGYIVATKTLGRHAGLLCGCALLVDYVLTVAISMASGVRALVEVLPRDLPQRVKEFQFLGETGIAWLTIVATVGLLLLNLRGVKESILVLMPVFLGFLVTHAVAIVWALVSHGSGVGAAFSESASTAGTLASTVGGTGLVVILLKAYTVGAGTYTGIEAVSNTVPILREPRVATAKRTMLYMAVSLAFTCGGLLLGYMLYGVKPAGDRPLNAVFLEELSRGTILAGWFVPLTLLTEGALLFVAAQAGYVSGPRALASMAVDSWVPRWFRRLSDRLTISNGILLIGVGAVGAVFLTRGKVEVLVVLYAFSVFVTFFLSQLGMCVHHLTHREPGWGGRLTVNAAAFLLSALVAVAMLVLRTKHAIWTGAIILVLGAVCVLIRLYYARMARILGRLDRLRTQVEAEPPRAAGPPEKDIAAPTAAVLVRGYNGFGIHTLMTVLRLFPNHFRNFVFVSVGDIDFDRFKGTREVEKLRDSVKADLEKYVALARKWGYFAEYRCALGVDVVDEVAEICPVIVRDFPRTMFFAGHLVFEQPTFLTRLLHEMTGEEIQRRLQFMGLTLIMLPIRVMEARSPVPPPPPPPGR